MRFRDLPPSLVCAWRADVGSPLGALPSSAVDVCLDCWIAVVGRWPLGIAYKSHLRTDACPRRPGDPKWLRLCGEPHLIDVELRLLLDDVVHVSLRLQRIVAGHQWLGKLLWKKRPYEVLGGSLAVVLVPCVITKR